jgi:hypothetical protein
MLGLLADEDENDEGRPRVFAAVSGRSVVRARPMTPAESGRNWVELEV